MLSSTTLRLSGYSGADTVYGGLLTEKVWFVDLTCGDIEEGLWNGDR